ncbi:MAG: ABC transporter permease [Christensenellales bacterium]|nr:ABC transporter permease [Christensenellales bacterium]
MLKFALKNMMIRRARVVLVTLSIMLSATVGLLAINISRQVSDGIVTTAGYYDMIIGPAGSSTQLAMNTMFFTDEPLGTISHDIVSELEASGLTNAVIPFTMGDSFNSAKIVGTSPAYLEGKSLRSGAMFEEAFEAVVGAAVAERYGLELGQKLVTSHGLTGTGHSHEATPLTVCGILAETGTAYDNVIFTSCETVWAVHEHGEDEHEHAEDEHEHAGETEGDHAHEEEAGEEHDHAGAVTDDRVHVAAHISADVTQEAEEEHDHSHTGEVCAVLVKSKSFNDYYKLLDLYGADASLLCINPSTVLREVLEQVDLSSQIVYILCAIILLMNIVVISVITLLNMYDAQKEIALMRLIGVGMSRIGLLYLIQNSVIGLIATLLSLGMAHACLGLMGQYVASMGIVLSVATIYPVEWAVMGIVFVLSVLPTMVRILVMSAQDSLNS